MLVKNWMNVNVPTINDGDSMANAIRTMKDTQVQMLPVMAANRLVGVVTDRDLKRASASDATSLEIHELLYILDQIKVSRVMTCNPVTVYSDFTLEETAQLLLEHRISGVPVVDRTENLVGTIMQTELFKAFISMTGIEKKGVQFAMELMDLPGSIKAAADVIRKYDGRIISILSAPSLTHAGRRRVYLRAFGIDRAILSELVNNLRDVGILSYMVDHRNNIRELYVSDRLVPN